jgi:Skp family chaperone for outer membrane proteins
MKLFQALCGTVLSATLLGGIAFAADQVGVVDTQLVLQKYNKAQAMATEAKSKEEDLQKLKDSLLQKLKAGDKLSPIEKKNLEDKLNAEFAEKFKAYREWSVTQEQSLKSDFDKAVKSISDSDKLDLVLPKQGVIEGGRDITDDVLNLLNKSE